MAMKTSIGGLKEADLKGTKVLERVGLKFPLNGNLKITRNRAADPTSKHLSLAANFVKTGMSMTEKILARASEKPHLSPGENVWVNVDVLMTHDVCGPGSIGIFKKEFGQNAKVWDREKIVIIPDHYIFTTDERTNRNVDILRDFCMEQNIKYFYDIEDLGNFKANPDYKGVCHIALAQEGHCRPGEVLLGTDSHTCNAGAFGQFATGIGNTDAGFVLGTGKLLLKEVAEASAAAPGVFHVKARGKEAFWPGGYQARGKRQRREESSQLEVCSLDDGKIIFSDMDLQGRPPRDGHLVITLKVGNRQVKNILVDTGASCNVMYLHSLMLFGFEAKLIRVTLSGGMTGFNGQEVRPMGVVALTVHAGSRTVETLFWVFDAPSSYNAILGTPWICAMKAVASTYHGMVKFPNQHGTATEEIRGD